MRYGHWLGVAVLPVLLGSCERSPIVAPPPVEPTFDLSDGIPAPEVPRAFPTLSRFLPPLPTSPGRFGPTDPGLGHHATLMVCQGLVSDDDPCAGQYPVTVETTYDGPSDAYQLMWYPPDPVTPATLYRLRIHVDDVILGSVDVEPVALPDGSLLGLRLPGASRLLTDEIPLIARFQIALDPRIRAHVARRDGLSVSEAADALIATFPELDHLPHLLRAVAAEFGPRASQPDNEWIAAAVRLGGHLAQIFGPAGPPLGTLRQLANALLLHYQLTPDEAALGLTVAGAPVDLVIAVLKELYGATLTEAAGALVAAGVDLTVAGPLLAAACDATADDVAGAFLAARASPNAVAEMVRDGFGQGAGATIQTLHLHGVTNLDIVVVLHDVFQLDNPTAQSVMLSVISVTRREVLLVLDHFRQTYQSGNFVLCQEPPTALMEQHELLFNLLCFQVGQTDTSRPLLDQLDALMADRAGHGLSASELAGLLEFLEFTLAEVSIKLRAAGYSALEQGAAWLDRLEREFPGQDHTLAMAELAMLRAQYLLDEAYDLMDQLGFIVDISDVLSITILVAAQIIADGEEGDLIQWLHDNGYTLDEIVEVLTDGLGLPAAETIQHLIAQGLHQVEDIAQAVRDGVNAGVDGIAQAFHDAGVEIASTARAVLRLLGQSAAAIAEAILRGVGFAQAVVDAFFASVPGSPSEFCMIFTCPLSSVSPIHSAVTANPLSVPVGGGTDVAITVTARDAADNPVTGVGVSLTAVGATHSMSAPPATDGAGQSVATLTPTGIIPGAITISAVVDGTPIGAVVVSVVPGSVSAGRSTVTSSAATVPRNGTRTITVTARDIFGNAIPGATVLLQGNGTPNAAFSSVGSAGQTTSLGVATATVRAGNVLGSITVGATVNGVLVGSTTITVIP